MSQPLASFQASSRIQDLFNTVFHSIPKVLVFLLILVIGWFVATASIVIVALGVIAALHQLGIAATVTQPILYAVLLTCGAISAIGVGGGLVKPMQVRWERMLTVADHKASSQLAAYEQGRADAMRAAQGPRYLQGPGLSRGPGYHQSFGYRIGGHDAPREPVRQEDPGQFAEADVQDDPDNYPGGQYM